MSILDQKVLLKLINLLNLLDSTRILSIQPITPEILRINSINSFLNQEALTIMVVFNQKLNLLLNVIEIITNRLPILLMLKVIDLVIFSLVLEALVIVELTTDLLKKEDIIEMLIWMFQEVPVVELMQALSEVTHLKDLKALLNSDYHQQALRVVLLDRCNV